MTRFTPETPRWVWRGRVGRTRVRVYPTGLAALCLLQFLFGLTLLWMLPMWVALLTPAAITQTTLDAMRINVLGALLYVLFAIGCTVIHELGHVAGGQLAGTPAKSYVLGSYGRIYTEPPITARAQLLLKASGPIAALGYGTILLALAPVTTPTGAAGIWAIGAGLTNLLPIPSGTDGHSVWQAVRTLLASRPTQA